MTMYYDDPRSPMRNGEIPGFAGPFTDVNGRPYYENMKTNTTIWAEDLIRELNNARNAPPPPPNYSRSHEADVARYSNQPRQGGQVMRANDVFVQGTNSTTTGSATSTACNSRYNRHVPSQQAEAKPQTVKQKPVMSIDHVGINYKLCSKMLTGTVKVPEIAFFNDEYVLLPYFTVEDKGFYGVVKRGVYMDIKDHIIPVSEVHNVTKLLETNTSVPRANSNVETSKNYTATSSVEASIVTALKHCKDKDKPYHYATMSIDRLIYTDNIGEKENKDFIALHKALLELAKVNSFIEWAKGYKLIHRDYGLFLPEATNAIDRRLTRIILRIIKMTFNLDVIFESGVAEELNDIVKYLNDPSNRDKLPLFEAYFKEVISDIFNFTIGSLDGKDVLLMPEVFGVLVIDEPLNLINNSSITRDISPGIISHELLPELSAACRYISNDKVKQHMYYVIVSTDGGAAIVERFASVMEGMSMYNLVSVIDT